MSKIKGIALDIDEILSWTVLKIFKSLQEKFGNPENLTPEEAYNKYRYTFNPPYYQSKEIQQWVANYVNTNEFQMDLPLMPDAQLFVNKIHQEIMPIEAYITIRSKEVTPGTQYWLSNNNFPHARIITCPQSTEFLSGSKWKARTLKSLFNDIDCIVDDNENLVKDLDLDYQGVIFLYSHKTKPETNLNVIPCQDWATVYKEMQKFYSPK